MKQLHDLMLEASLMGQVRETRSGLVRGVFRREFSHDMRKGLPFPMTKKLMYKAVMGELLWFINGETTLPELRHRSSMKDNTVWTIWSNDCERWHGQGAHKDSFGNVTWSDDLGKLYGHQWRCFGETKDFKGVDQLYNLVYNIINNPTSRYLIVQAYNPTDVEDESAALPPCHTGFQVYVDIETNEIDLIWDQRSVDIYLGLPFNIASYAMLLKILGQLTGLTPRFLYGSLKDCHIYEAHIPAVYEQLLRTPRHCLAEVYMPEFENLDDISKLTAGDFPLSMYEPDPAIKAPLLVG